MAYRTKESEKSCEALLRDFIKDGPTPESLLEPLAKLTISLRDDESILQARYFERAKAHKELMNTYRTLKGEPNQRIEIHHVRDLTDEDLAKRLQAAETKPAESKSESDKTLH